MNLRRYRPFVPGFLLAVLVTALLGSIIQTQINLAALQAMGAPVPPDIRLRTTGQDLIGFTPAYAGIVCAAFLVALPTGAWAARRLGWPGAPVLAVAAVVGLGIALQVTDAVAPMPTLIAATRDVAGTAWMLTGALVGGLLFGWSMPGHRRASA